jgi:riboflavin synthase
MFTGIIEEIGIVRNLFCADKIAQLVIESKICSLHSKQGDSISVNGCCLTLTKIDGAMLTFDISPETLKRANLAGLAAGEKVNVEQSLKMEGRLGGHFVTGHIDYTARILSMAPKGDCIEIKIEIAKGFERFLAEKGSVAVDGVSLTVNNVSDNSFTIMLIPHTLHSTTLINKDKGSRLNIETDILAKYTHNLMNKNTVGYAANTDLNKEFLSDHGFI